MRRFMIFLVGIQCALFLLGVWLTTAYLIGVEGWTTTLSLGSGLFCMLVNPPSAALNIHTIKRLL